ncbi:MAG: hypothetical protein H0V09_11955 [Gemmatimonadetes bacterium]|nr:hypothetical protein [Gemmatimonadota bacterium]
MSISRENRRGVSAAAAASDASSKRSDALFPGLGKEGFASSSADATALATTIHLDRSARFVAPGGDTVELAPGAYRVQVGGDGHLILTSADGRNTHALQASITWHELNLTSPLALHVPGSGPGTRSGGESRAPEDDGGQILLSHPGGCALWAMKPGETPSRAERAHRALGATTLAEAVLKWQPVTAVGPLPFDKSLLSQVWRVSPKAVGTIEPGASPSGFGPSNIPPYWISAAVSTQYVPPAGSYGGGGPGTASGVPMSPPGTEVRRGAFPGYLISVTPVMVASSLSIAGRLVRLLVTSHVIDIGFPTILSTTWTDVYQLVPQGGGPATFPEVIVATGHVPTTPPAPNTTWAAEVAKRLTAAAGSGAPTLFELQVDGITIAERICRYNARFPQSPELLCG